MTAAYRTGFLLTVFHVVLLSAGFLILADHGEGPKFFIVSAVALIVVMASLVAPALG